MVMRHVHVVVSVMMVAHAGESHRRNQHQRKGSEYKLLHGLRLAPTVLC
jgi:hypothetical protein